MAGPEGDGDSVRRLGQALHAAGRGLSSVTSDLSGQVKGLIPAGWPGDAADSFTSDWSAKAGQAVQLAAICTHIGQTLVDLGNAIDWCRASSSVMAISASSASAASAFMTSGAPSRA